MVSISETHWNTPGAERGAVASERADTVAVAVMVKAPQAGRTKTRLVPPLDREGAAALSAAFLRDTTENIALAARSLKVAGGIAYAPAGAQASFDGMLAPGTFRLLADGEISMSPRVRALGRSLVHAVRAILGNGFTAACLINSDSPTLPTEFLRRAATALLAAGDRIVLGPAEDGGYYLIGMKRPHDALFEDIDWSTQHVTDQTRERARSLGLEVMELPAWYDVDDAASLGRLVHELEAPPNGAYSAPVTVSCIGRLGLTSAR